ncbi:MAG: alternative ribosome rescue aminoacyl-tRNA hydrolase ArfB [Pseudomonadota bacterium]
MSVDAIRLSNGREIPAWALSEVFIHASGPGGQNVNKVETGVQLRFNAVATDVFTASQSARLARLAGKRATKAGEIIIEATRHRTRERNRVDARQRLIDLVEKAIAPPPPPRRKTRPTKGSIERRLKAKANRSTIKKLRHNPSDTAE